MAHLMSNPSYLIELMNWDKAHTEKNNSQRSEIKNDLSQLESEIVKICSRKGNTHFDQFVVDLKVPVQELNNILFNLEIVGAIKAFPGRIYGI